MEIFQWKILNCTKSMQTQYKDCNIFCTLIFPKSHLFALKATFHQCFVFFAFWTLVASRKEAMKKTMYYITLNISYWCQITFNKFWRCVLQYKRSSTRSEVWEFKGEIDKSRTFQWTPATWTNLLQPLYTSSISYYWISQNISEKYFNEYFSWIFQIEPWQLEPTSFVHI